MIVLLSFTLFFVVIAGLIAFVYLVPARAVEVALNATRRQSGLVRKTISLPDGLRTAYLEGGHGEPLLLLHGFGGNKDTFTRVSRYLVKRYRVLIPDITGFGESEHPPQTDYSTWAQVARLRAFSQALNLGQLHLGGNSMGGQLAMLYAAQHPSEVSSLWLISPSGIWSAPRNEILNAMFASGPNPLIARNEDEFVAVMALGMSKPPFIPKPMLKVLAQERIQNVALEERISKSLLNHSIEEQILGMSTPTLVVFGSQDRVIPFETAHILSTLLPNSSVVSVPNAGHVAMFERPRQCANDYMVFRESLATQTKPNSEK